MLPSVLGGDAALRDPLVCDVGLYGDFAVGELLRRRVHCLLQQRLNRGHVGGQRLKRPPNLQWQGGMRERRQATHLDGDPFAGKSMSVQLAADCNPPSPPPSFRSGWRTGGPCTG